MSDNQHIQAQFPRKFGNYHLLAPLTQGSMSALYLAVEADRGLERLLVLKTVRSHVADEEYLARFRDEAKLVLEFSHGNLIPAFDAGQIDGEPFLAMELIEGRDLRTVWNRCARKRVAFPIDVAVYIVKELCHGLAYVHSLRDLELVHRDVSPPNIILSFSGEVKLTDFGLASSTMKQWKAPPGIIYGKVAYMSPEQARGEELDGRSDLYAAAIVLWEMLTGQQLFPPGKDQPRDLIERARNPRVPAPSSHASRVPTRLDEICIKGLSARKEDRYASGDELREALTAFLASEYPRTDASRLESFLGKLFAEDIQRERKEREELLEKFRNPVQTMPSTDELRRAAEQAGGLDAGVRPASDSGQSSGAPVLGQSRRHIDVGAPGSVSREAVLLQPPRETSQATSWTVDDHVSGHILAAAGAITGLDMATPVGIETRDVPRWSYLAAVVPDLGTRLRQLRLDPDEPLSETEKWVVSSRDEDHIDLDQLLLFEEGLDRDRDAMTYFATSVPELAMEADERAHQLWQSQNERYRRAGLPWLSRYGARGPLGSAFGTYELALPILLPPELGRTRAAQIATLARMIDGPLPLDCEKLLGAYHPVNHQIILFPWMIELTAMVMGWSASTLERVAILHEASHAILIEGIGAASKGWETYDQAPERMHEILACMLTEATARRLGAASEAQLAGTITELATPEACLLADFPGGPASLACMVREGWFDGISDAVVAMARRVLAERCQTTAAPTHLLVRMNELDPWERTILQVAIAQCLVAGPAPTKGSAVRLEIQMVRKALQDQRMSAIPRTGEWVFPRIADDPAFLRVQALLEGGDVTHAVSARSSK
jgi:serine/threonine protein kinase